MEFCRLLRSVKFVVRSLGRFLGRGACLWLRRSQGSLTQDTHQRATPGKRNLPLSTSFRFQQPSIPFIHPHFHQN